MKILNRKLGNNISLFISSLSIGWMAGLSISPVVGVMISSVVAIIVSAVSILSGLKYQTDEDGNQRNYIKDISSLNVFPFAILCVGLAVGSALGIYTRTHKLLDDHSLAVKAVTNSKNNREADPKALQTTGALYFDTATVCQLMELKHGQELRAFLKATGDKNVQFLAKSCPDDSCLEALKNILCDAKR